VFGTEEECPKSVQLKIEIEKRAQRLRLGKHNFHQKKTAVSLLVMMP